MAKAKEEEKLGSEYAKGKSISHTRRTGAQRKMK